MAPSQPTKAFKGRVLKPEAIALDAVQFTEPQRESRNPTRIPLLLVRAA